MFWPNGGQISSATFWCLFGILLEDKKSCMAFCRPFLSLGRQKVTKRTAKSRTSFFVLQFGQQAKKDSKKSLRLFWTAKGRHGEKDGKKSGHLCSPLVNSSLVFSWYKCIFILIFIVGVQAWHFDALKNVLHHLWFFFLNRITWELLMASSKWNTCCQLTNHSVVKPKERNTVLNQDFTTIILSS